MAKLWCSFLIIFLVACNDHKPADQKTQRTGNDGQSGQTTQRTSNDNQSGPTWTENGFLADFQSKARKFSTKGNSVAHGESVTAFEKLCDLRYDAIKSDMIYLEFSQAQNTGKLYCGKSPVKVTFKYDVVNDSLLKFKDLQFDKDSQKKFAWGPFLYSTAAALEKSLWFFNKTNNTIETVFAYKPSLLDEVTIDLPTGALTCPSNTKLKTIKEAPNCGPLDYLAFAGET